MQRNLETTGETRREFVGGTHATTAPPENEKNDRKNEDAANAIDSPNTIWISLRKPPDVSPKARARPVEMMMMTATMRATGPWIDSRMDCSGPSQGMLEPAAWAGKSRHSISAASTATCNVSRRCGFTEKREVENTMCAGVRVTVVL